MNRTFWILFTAFIVLLFPAAWAQTADDEFNRGNELYRKGQFQEAVKEYEHILKQGFVSAELYYNLGNAYYRNEQLARAILSYERAAQLRTNDPDIEHNLKLVYFKTVDRIEPIPEMFFIQWLHTIGSLLSRETVRLFFVLSWVLVFSSLATMYLVFQPQYLRAARMIFFISSVSVVLWAAMIGIQAFQESSQDKAIITAQIVTAKSSPDTNSVDAFVIHEGLKVKLSDAVGRWVKITLVDGKVGWIPVDQCEHI